MELNVIEIFQIKEKRTLIVINGRNNRNVYLNYNKKGSLGDKKETYVLTEREILCNITNM